MPTYKPANKKNGILPAKLVEKNPRNKLYVDLIGSYKMRRKGKYTLILKAVIMIEFF